MKSFPVFLKLAGERVVIVGGGEEAAQKARLILKTEAAVTVMAPELCAELADHAAAGRIAHRAAVADPAVFGGARLAVIATGCAGADGAIAALARSARVLVNVVDRPDLCDVTTPAIVDRDPVVVAIGTEGAAPVLARQVKTAVEAMLEPSLGQFTAMMGALRGRIAWRIAPERRRAFWEWAFARPRRLWTGGDEAAARALIDAALRDREIPDDGPARVALLEAGEGPADLLSLRAVQRLQSADLVVHGPLSDPQMLELPRRDAERHALAPGDPPHAALIEAAAEGRNAVFLARGAASLDGAPFAEAGVAVERIAGVSGLHPLPEEGRSDADERGAQRDGALEVGAHPHRQAG